MAAADSHRPIPAVGVAVLVACAFVVAAYLAVSAATRRGVRDGPWIGAMLGLALAVAAVVWMGQHSPMPGCRRPRVEPFEAPDAVPMAASGHVPPMPKGMSLRSYYTTLSSESFSTVDAWHMQDLAGKTPAPPARLAWSSVLHAGGGARAGEPPSLNRGTMGLNVRDYKGTLALARAMPASTREYSIFLMLKIDPGQWTSSVARAPVLGISSHGNTRNVGVSLFARIDAATRTVYLGLEHGCENTAVASSTAGACDAGNNYVGEIANQYLFEPLSTTTSAQAPRFADGEFHLLTVVRSVNTDNTVHSLELFVDDARALSVVLPVRTDTRSKPMEAFVEDARIGLGMFVNEQGVVPMSVVAVGTYDVALTVPDMQEISRHLRGNLLIHTDALVRSILEDTYRARSAPECALDEDTCAACPEVDSWAGIDGVLAASMDCQRKVARACESSSDAAVCRELSRDRALKILQAVSPTDYLSLVNLLSARESSVRDASVDVISLDKTTRGAGGAGGAGNVHSAILETVLRDAGDLSPEALVGSVGRRDDGLRYVAPATTPIAAAEGGAMVDVGVPAPAPAGAALGGPGGPEPTTQDAYDRIIDRFHREAIGPESARSEGGVLDSVGGFMESIGRLFSWGS